MRRARLTAPLAVAVCALAAVQVGGLPSAQASPVARAAPAGVVAAAGELINATSGQRLWSRDLNAQLPIASLTKVMAAMVVLADGGLNRKIRVTEAAVQYAATNFAGSAGLHAGDVLTARQLLEGLLLPSGADAAYTLAKAYGPGLAAFVAKMNATARLLGMRRTHFSNFDGLPYPTPYSNYSTAANLLVLARAAMLLPAFRAVVHRRGYRLAAGSGHHAYRWTNINPLIGRYPGAIGIKTGYTRAAGQCLLFEATRNGRSVIGITLHSPGSISPISPADATRILNWAFTHLKFA
jgi:serine-type D-Ala-D-Ala carboxypeptidase (penicillin-binding protein 5/6)